MLPNVAGLKLFEMDQVGKEIMSYIICQKLTHQLVDLIEPLSEEVDDCVQQSWTDNPVNMRRYATEKIWLSSSISGDKEEDSFTIPKGYLVMTSQHNTRDEEIYANAALFDPYRFYKIRQTPTQEHASHFVSASVNHIGFGHGVHGCPGRFFDAAETKLAMCHILMKYDITLVDQP
ncbi:unnamed protein product [Penicillium pancosmium]